MSTTLQQAPSGNTGSQITDGMDAKHIYDTVSLGWLDFTVQGHWDDYHEALDWAKRYAGEWVPRRGTWRGYALSYTSTNGVTIGLRRTSAGQEAHFNFPASALDTLNNTELRGLVFFVARIAKNVTRLDVSMDDYKKIKTPTQIHRMIKKTPDKLVTRVDLQKSIRYMESNGGTLYLGSTSGTTMLRVYDKSAESAMKVDAIRWELQMRNERARGFLLHWLHFEGFEKLGEAFSSALVGFVDFRNRAEDSNITRAGRLPWFKGLVGSAQRAKRVALEKLDEPTEINDLREYFERSCAGLLATLLEASHLSGDCDWLARVLDLGRSRKNTRQQLALKRFQTNQKVSPVGDFPQVG